MTEDNAKKKLTLSGKSTLTLKLGASSKSSNADGKKMVQVEVRKKRVIGQSNEPKVQKPQIDEETYRISQLYNGFTNTREEGNVYEHDKLRAVLFGRIFGVGSFGAFGA